MASLLPLSPRAPVAPGPQYFEMPKTQMDQTESRPTRTFPHVQPTLPPFTSSHKQNPDFQDHTSDSVQELKPRSHSSKMSIQLGSPTAQTEPVQGKPLSPIKLQPTSRSPKGPLLHSPQIATTSGKRKKKAKKAVTVDVG